MMKEESLFRELRAAAEMIPKELTQSIQLENLNKLKEELKSLVKVLSEKI